MNIQSYNILLLGEEYDKTEFLLMCIPEKFKIKFLSLKEQYRVTIIVKGIRELDKVEIEYNQDKGVIEAFTNKVPEFIQIFCKYNDMMGIYISSISFEKYNKVFLISSWQYENAFLENIIEKREDIYFQAPMLEIWLVLLQSRIKTGATDLNNQEDVIKKAHEKYKKLINTIIIKEGDSLLKLLCPKLEIETSITVKYYKEFKNWKDILNDKDIGFLFDFLELEVIPEILEQYIDVENLEKIYGFQAIKGSENIIKTFWENFYSSEGFYKKAEYKIINYYKEFVTKICVWDLEQDIEIIKQELKKLYDVKMESNIEEVYKAPKNLVEYDKLEEKKKIKIKFYQKLKEYYIDDVANYLICHLNKKQKKIIKQIEKNQEEV